MDPQSQQAPEQMPKPSIYTVKGIRIDGFAKSVLHLHDHYVTVKIGKGDVQSYRKVGVKERALVWMESTDARDFEVLVSDILELKLYEAPIVGNTKGKQVGSLSQPVRVLLDSAKGTPWTLVMDSKKQKAILTVKFDIFEKVGKTDDPPNTSSTGGSVPSDERASLDKAITEAQVDLAKLGEPPIPSSVIGAVGDGIEKVADMYDSESETWNPVLEKLDVFMTIMDNVAEIHPYAKMAWSVVSAAYKVYKHQVDRDENINKLAEKMKAAYETILASDSLKKLADDKATPKIVDIQEAIKGHEDVLLQLSKQTYECGHFISTYAKDRTFFKRCLMQTFSSPQAAMDKFSEKFENLQLAFDRKATLNTEIMVVRVLQTIESISTTVQEMDTKMILSDLPYVAGAGCDSGKQCIPGTRTAVLDNLTEWINNTDLNTPRVKLLLGQAGVGKSTIAHTLACRFRDLQRLGSAFCFSSASTQRSQHLFSTLAKDLADFDIQFKQALCKRIGKTTADRTTSDIRRQLELFIIEPSQNVALIGSILILIDGLDEIGDVVARAPLLRILSEHLGKLPQGFRVLLTARPESDILALFKNTECDVNIQYVNTSQSDPTLQADIQLFIRTELTKPELRIRDLGESHFHQLMERSEGVFQWARLACDYIIAKGKRGRRPRERCDDLLKPRNDERNEGAKANVLDELYFRVLADLIDLDDEEAMIRFRLVMGLVLNVVEPVTVQALQGLARHLPDLDVDDEHDDVLDILSTLGSLLSGVSEPNRAVQPLHSSFRDFLTSEARSKKVVDSITIADCYIGHANAHHANLTNACLRVLNTELHFNMCNLETSYRLNVEIPDLDTRVDHLISSALSYASRFWAQHVSRESGFTASLMEDVKVLLEINFLFWVEVVSLLGTVKSVPWALSAIIPIIQMRDVILAEVATSWLRFVRNLARPISDSTPHIYISALSNIPNNYRSKRQYGVHIWQIAHISAGRMETWPTLHKTLKGHSSAVHCVAFSPDGRRLVSCSGDTTVQMWDAETGEPLRKPLLGHRSSVRSVAFSPDGKWIVSGSEDRTIRIWDAETDKPGRLVRDSLDMPSRQIYSVAFSPNGKQIVSGSRDNTVRIWDTETGEPVRAPLESHRKSVLSVAFSPDGKHIVSGSHDCSIRIWEAETAQYVYGSNGDASVRSVAFSSDGMWVVSGDEFGNIRQWYPRTGSRRAPLQGHTAPVYSVAFSPDGTQIVSGSQDKTVRIWNAQTGEPVRAPLEGHDGSVYSVAFSPDGKRIASGSFDNTIRIWDAEADEPAGVPSTEERNSVLSIAYSPDGQRVVSGSEDHLVQIWDAETGAAVQDPLVGHSGFVHSVAFSPDGTRIVSGSEDGTVRIWDAETGEPVRDPLEGHGGTVYSVTFSPDGRYIMSGSDDATIRIWDAETGELVRALPTGYSASGYSDELYPNAKQSTSSPDDRLIQIWDVETGQPVRAAVEGCKSGPVLSVAYSPDGKWIASGSYDPMVRLTGLGWGEDEPVRGALESHRASVCAVSFSPDGTQIMSGLFDHTVRIWDTKTGEPIGAPLVGHSDFVCTIALSPDGKRILSGSADNTLQIWDVESGKPIRAMGHSDTVRSVAFSPDGTRIVSGSEDGTIRIWDAGTSEPLESGRDSPGSVQGFPTPVVPDELKWITPSSEDGLIRIPSTEVTIANMGFSPDVDHHLVQPYIPANGGPVRVSVDYRTGWIICNETDYLFWLAPEQLRYLLTPGCRLVVPTSRMVTLDMRQFVHGARWTECYRPDE